MQTPSTMPSPDPHHRPLTPTLRENLFVQLTDDGSRTLMDTRTGNGFHSASGAASETREVYLINSGVKDRLEHGKSTRVLEVGLGTGLGLLMTVDTAMTNATPLEYHAFETDWLPASILSQLEMEKWIENGELVESFIEFRRSADAQARDRQWHWAPFTDVRATVHWSDIREWQPKPDGQSDWSEPSGFDAIYFDPFAPHAAPTLWTIEMLDKMYRALNPGGALATYSCSREVRETLEAVGFSVTVLRGPKGGKRNVLLAKRDSQSLAFQ